MKMDRHTHTRIHSTALNLLVLDSNIFDVLMLKSSVFGLNVEVQAAYTEAEASLICERFTPDLICAAHDFDGMDGRELCAKLRATLPNLLDTPAVFLTDHTLNPLTCHELLQEGFGWVFEKPVECTAFARFVKALVNQKIKMPEASLPLYVECGSSISTAALCAVEA